jgi:hypothetical protein
MKCNAWTLALLGAGIVSLPSVTQAEERTNAVLSALSATTISGYVDTSAQWNMGTGNLGVPTYAFGGTSKADGFNLNVVKLTLEKALEPTDSWAAGYKVDLIAGPDANVLNTSSTGSSSDFGVKQAYVALRTPVGNGLDFKLGVFDTIIGYEVFESGNNPNFTRSYGYTIEPTTHTGALMSYQFADWISANVGIANTVGPTINGRAFYDKAESYKTYMGTITLTAPEDMGALAGSTLTAGVINGFNESTPSPTGSTPGDQTSWYIGATFSTPVTGLKVGASYDYLGISDQSLREAGWANATAIYASYQLSEKMTLYARGEYASSDTPSLFGAEEVVAVTTTLQYDLWKNVLSRLEFRWDHATDGTEPYGGETTAGGKDNSFILAANIIYKF